MDRNAIAEAEAARKQVSRLTLPELADLLQSRRADWVVREMALQRLLVITRNGGIDADAPEFKAVVAGLVEQLPDLRSQVARTTCATTVELALAVGDHSAFDRPLREMLLPALVDLVSNGNKVLATAGRETLLPLFTHCHFQGMLKVLATYLKESKHPAVKLACTTCLVYALQFWPKQVRLSFGHCSPTPPRFCSQPTQSRPKRPRSCAAPTTHYSPTRTSCVGRPVSPAGYRPADGPVCQRERSLSQCGSSRTLSTHLESNTNSPTVKYSQSNTCDGELTRVQPGLPHRCPRSVFFLFKIRPGHAHALVFDGGFLCFAYRKLERQLLRRTFKKQS